MNVSAGWRSYEKGLISETTIAYLEANIKQTLNTTFCRIETH